MRIIHYAKRTLYGMKIELSAATWKELPVTVKYDDLHHGKFWFRIQGRVYDWNTPEFDKAFEEARAWELLAR